MLPSTIKIRTALNADCETITAFNTQLAKESEGLDLHPQTIRAGVARALSSPSLCTYYVAEINSRVVGQTMITPELSDWRDGIIWWIQSVYVEPTSRRLGVFRSLHEHILEAAKKDKDIRCVRLYVEHENTRALKTYQSLGMSETGYRIMEQSVSGYQAGKQHLS